MKKFGLFIYFGSCQSPEVVKSGKNRQRLVSELKIFTSYVVYIRIWLNLPVYDRSFFYMFLWMDEANWANKKS
jgi:hypothetical protein